MTRARAKQLHLARVKRRREGAFGKWVFPVIRSVPVEDNLVAALVSVQPMSAPNSQAFYMDYVRDSWWERLKRKIFVFFRWRKRVRYCRRGGV